jgi:hypothetical protein
MTALAERHAMECSEHDCTVTGRAWIPVTQAHGHRNEVFIRRVFPSVFSRLVSWQTGALSF